MKKLIATTLLALGLLLTSTGTSHATGSHHSNDSKYDVCDYLGPAEDTEPLFAVYKNLTWAEANVYNGPNDIIFVANTDTIGSSDSQSFRCFLVYGTMGKDGPPGPQGPVGPPGEQGPSGPSGPEGTPGKDSIVPGPSGKDGVNGLAGEPTVTSPAESPVAKSTPRELPRTGTGDLALLGFALVVIGGVIWVLARR